MERMLSKMLGGKVSSNEEGDFEDESMGYSAVEDLIDLIKDPKASKEELADAFRTAVSECMNVSDDEEEGEDKPVLKIKIK